MPLGALFHLIMQQELDLRLSSLLHRDPRDEKLEDRTQQNKHSRTICRPWQQHGETYLSDKEARCARVVLEDPCAKQELSIKLVLSDFEGEPTNQWNMLPGTRVTGGPGTWSDWKVALRVHSKPGKPTELSVFRQGQSYLTTELPDWVLANLLFFAERPPVETRSPILARFPLIGKIFPPMPVPIKQRTLERFYMTSSSS